jgi:hypothetical protein
VRKPEAAPGPPLSTAPSSFKDDSARFETAGGAWCASSRPARTHLYRVTKVIGGRYREDFAGVEVRDEGEGQAEAATVPAPSPRAS